jgi:hypothetical protein
MVGAVILRNKRRRYFAFCNRLCVFIRVLRLLNTQFEVMSIPPDRGNCARDSSGNPFLSEAGKRAGVGGWIGVGGWVGVGG